MTTPLFRSRILRGAALVALLASFPVGAADMTKVIRHVFPVAETGFDPAAAHDLYSGTIEQAMAVRGKDHGVGTTEGMRVAGQPPI